MATTAKSRAEAERVAKFIADVLACGEVRKAAKMNHASETWAYKEWRKFQDQVAAAGGLTPKATEIAKENRDNRFNEAFFRFSAAAMDMLTAQAELLTDKRFIETRPTPDVIAHSKFICDRLQKFIELSQGNHPGAAALPAGDIVIEGELIEEELSRVA